ncbi:putative mercuric transport protein (plasmid) [Afipia carboxidovorans OM5]|uniref:Mercuric transport protein MerT n=1 Tax=Afipia carboxidovorans (strain ATCC 49405 / DSM 1227 / KCTC 32145 / OM5) TaxID=504832 RepID=F8C1D2_AFIC5|nr:mercuric transporter MerT family protein [Afipia carboxidovorans]AEI04618.1 putative mercuric transport protein [Afipia carboxidovorans OM4]AEI08247.1 putative mercuric transport protein [Afipia carboxidovorans OM5]
MTSREADGPRDVTRLQNAAAAGGLLGTAAVSSCCMLPLPLFTLGASASWIGTLVRLAPYQPYFIAVAVACLGCGYWLWYRSSNQKRDAACSIRSASKFVNPALVVATILVVAAIAFNVLWPLLTS